MPLVALEIPRIGLVMENARIVRWLKAVGDMVRQGEPLLELETEKSVVEIEATESGRLVEILLQVDQAAKVGDRIAWLQTSPEIAVGAAGTATAIPKAAPRAPIASPPPPASTAPRMSPGARPEHARSAETAPITGGKDRIRSSPVARRLAAQHGIDLRSVRGSGPRGRIQLSDVHRRIAEPSAAPAARADQPQPLSSMRRAMARAMTLSNATVPQFIVESAVDWTPILELRTRLNARLPASAPRVSLNDFLLQSLARTLHAFPAMNATFSGDASAADAGLVPARGTHIGLVVALEDGVIVPVFHDADRSSLAALAAQRAQLVERAQQGRLRREELEGATISVSNLGARGPDRFTAMINPPQSAILAIGRQRDCVIARDGGIHVRPMSQLTLTVDHRVADGRIAAGFLAHLIGQLVASDWRIN